MDPVNSEPTSDRPATDRDLRATGPNDPGVGDPARSWAVATLTTLGVGTAGAWAIFMRVNRLENSPQEYDAVAGTLRWTSVGVLLAIWGISAWLMREWGPDEIRRMLPRESARPTGPGPQAQTPGADPTENVRLASMVRGAGRVGIICLVIATVAWFLPTPFAISRLLTAGALAVLAGIWSGRALWLAGRGLLLRRPEPCTGLGAMLAAGSTAAMILLILLMKLNGLAWAKAID